MLINETLTYISAAGSVAFSSRSGAVYHVNKDGVVGIDGLRNDLFVAEGAGQDGATLSGSALLPRNVTVAGTIQGPDQDACDAYLQRVFNPKLPGVLTYENGARRRTLAVSVEQAPAVTRGFQRRFHLSLIGHDPYFYEADGETRTDVASWIPLLEFDLEIPEEGFEIEARQESLIVDVLNPGDVDIGVRAVIRASDTVTAPEIMHMGTRERIVLNATLQGGDVVEVDTRQGRKGIWLTRAGRDRERAFQLRGEGMTFWSLSPGDNLIRYDAASGRENMTVEIYAASRYVSA